MWYLKKEKKRKILALSRKYKTPFYVYDRKTLLSELKKYLNTFKNCPVKFLYAFKANSNETLCKIIKREGFGADVVSGGELKLALKLGFKEISFSGVGKTEEEIELAVKNKISFINIESYEEFINVKKISDKLKIKTGISVRVNPEVEVDTHSYIKTAKKYSKFGVDFKTAFFIYNRALKSDYIDIKAIHFHLGSQIFKSRYYEIALKKIIKFLKELKALGVNINTIDIGGGWGVKEGNSASNHKDLLKVVKPYLKDFNFIMEPGRSIAASCGVIVSKVIYRKKVKNKWIVIIDAGMNNLIRPALYQAFHPIYNMSKTKGEKTVLDIAGPLCESSDFFAYNLFMPLPDIGDVLIISSAGAYAYSMASNYNLRGFSKELFI
ncbi:MAG TPA: diaminopimelate decarboxylase [Elusimicrobiales bacterium]|mgnify:CR=1 FL=1|nr:diaminopimelate decarboxylase [Elusimicrobiales bacterium]HOL61845.1 diaminopimelate decarboxylase [Elusimicrobiales bacterium]HPO95180.1 diaminopimelate decarboxylase [Elusimicrobiales bacterium]